VEKTAKVTKDIKQLRNFEETLLANYKSFISSLVTIIKAARTKESMIPLSFVAITCATSLLVAVPHFNFRTDILKIIVAQLSRHSADAAFVKCREAIETLFKDDEEGRAGLEAVGMISKMVKTRHYKVNPTVNHKIIQLITGYIITLTSTFIDGTRCQSVNRLCR
jgi:nucleolar complex protein 3